MPRGKLAVVAPEPADDLPPPPAGLDEVGAALWREILGTWHWDDPVPLRIVQEACLSLQRAERCRKIIDAEGEMIRAGKTMRSHPLLRDEAAARALGARLLSKLGTDLEPVKPLGRPPGQTFV